MQYLGPLVGAGLLLEQAGVIDVVPSVGASDGFIGPPFSGFGEARPRRRRRRMLSASDKVDIAYLAATLGPAAAVKLAAVRLANIS